MKTKPGRPAQAPARGKNDVEAFLAGLEHPMKAGIAAVRRIILGVDPAIGETIKWNSPSFRTTEFFATVNLRSRDEVQLVFHLGAKKRAGLKAFKIDDPAGMIRWLGDDRCLVTVRDLPASGAAFAGIVRQWIKHV